MIVLIWTLNIQPLPPLLAAVLPKGYSYLFKTLHYIKNPTDLAFSATIYINIMSEEGATKWIKDLEGYTATTYRVTRGNCVKGFRVLYKSDRHCQHKRKKSSKCINQRRSIHFTEIKRTDCLAHFTIKVHNPKAWHSSTHPCEVMITTTQLSLHMHSGRV